MAKSKAASSKSNGKTKLVPLGDRVVLERESAEETTAGGIVLPDSAKDKPQRGKVISVGDGRVLKDGKRHPLTVKRGDRVLFSSYAGDEFKLDGNELVLMREDDILAILEG
jgi:chaperonin GroES